MSKRIKVLLVLLALSMVMAAMTFMHLVTGDIGRIQALDRITNIDVKGQNTFYSAAVIITGVKLRMILYDNYSYGEIIFSNINKPVQYYDDLEIIDDNIYHKLTYNDRTYVIPYTYPEEEDVYTGLWKYRYDGTSSGMLMVLQRLQALTPEDITAGYRITGTGAYSLCMRVDMVANIYEKLNAAHNNNMDYFLVAGDNYKEAQRIKKELQLDIEIIPVYFIQEAVAFLEQLEPQGM